MVDDIEFDEDDEIPGFPENAELLSLYPGVRTYRQLREAQDNWSISDIPVESNEHRLKRNVETATLPVAVQEPPVKKKRVPRNPAKPKVPRVAKPKAVKLLPEDLRREQCAACPYLCKKTASDHIDDSQVEILIVSDSYVRPMEHLFDRTPIKVKQAHLVECLKYGEDVTKKELEAASYCCVGRKLNQIDLKKPKLILSIGYRCYQQIELALGNVPSGVSNFTPMPSEYNGHKFWHYSVPEKGAEHYVNEHLQEILDTLKLEPEIADSNDDGIVFVTDTADIDAAFDWLEQQPIVSFDIETTGLSPFKPNDKGIEPLILSIAIGTDERVYSFPLFHPQTPSDFDAFKVLDRLWKLATKVSMIGHNVNFELDWIGSLLPGFEYLNVFHDTMAQAYLLVNAQVSKSLDACVRRLLGFGLKAISGVDVKNLYDTPIEKVLIYNARDVKYTHKIHFLQVAQLLQENLHSLYFDHHLPFIPAVVQMRRKGLHIDTEFARVTGIELQKQYEEAEDTLFNIPEVKKFIADNGSFNLDSTPQMRKLMYDYVGVPTTQTSFDEKNLATLKNPVAKAIVDVRKINKLHSTYVLPYNIAEDGGGKSLCSDGRVHSSISTIRTVTARLSTSDPNSQNFPSRGGKKKYRNVVDAPPGYCIAAVDKAQIEYRVIGCASRDAEMVHAINNDFDVHMAWAKRLAEKFTYLVKDPTDPKQMDEFRSSVKNQWTFPLCFGSSPYNVASNLKIKPKDKPRLVTMVEKEFWDHHTGVKAWHQSLEKELREKGYITSITGRRFLPPLSFNEMINYGIQSVAHDMVAAEFTRLARMAHDLNEPDLCPINEIHDDLTFYIREDRIDELLPIIIEVMVDVRKYDWVIVPIEVEVSIGYTWGAMEKFGKYRNTDWDFKL